MANVESIEKLRGKRILWFSTIPSLYLEKVNTKTTQGGWIPSLERLFREYDIELALAFHYEVKTLKKEVYKKGVYYLIPKVFGRNKVERWIQRIFNKYLSPQTVLPYYKQVVDDYKPDLVHIWGSENLYGLIISYLTVPHILHVQGNINAYLQMFYNGFSEVEMKKARTIKDIVKREPFFYKEKLYQYLCTHEKDIFEMCENFFGRTEWDKRIVKALSNDAKYFFCNEVMREQFYNSAWERSFNGEELRIVSVFRESNYKGIETIFDTAKLLKQKNVSFRWEIVGIENGSQSLRVLKKNRDYNLDALPIYLKGPLDADKMIDVYNSIDLFVHVSHIDNSPNSVCEAMLLGVPVISTNVGGIPSIIADGVQGYLFQDRDVLALLGCILDVKENYDKACSLASNAKQVALSRHNYTNILNTVTDTYWKLLEK